MHRDSLCGAHQAACRKNHSRCRRQRNLYDRPSSGVAARPAILAGTQIPDSRGYRDDEIAVDNLGSGSGKISDTAPGPTVTGAALTHPKRKRIEGGAVSKSMMKLPPLTKKYSVSFAVTPQVVLEPAGPSNSSAAARGGWSDVYFRQPDDLISNTRGGPSRTLRFALPIKSPDAEGLGYRTRSVRSGASDVVGLISAPSGPGDAVNDRRVRLRSPFGWQHPFDVSRHLRDGGGNPAVASCKQASRESGGKRCRLLQGEQGWLQHGSRQRSGRLPNRYRCRPARSPTSINSGELDAVRVGQDKKTNRMNAMTRLSVNRSRTRPVGRQDLPQPSPMAAGFIEGPLFQSCFHMVSLHFSTFALYMVRNSCDE